MWLESPTNPTLRITDLEEASKIAHAHTVNYTIYVIHKYVSLYKSSCVCLEYSSISARNIVGDNGTFYLQDITVVVDNTFASSYFQVLQ